MCRVQKVQQAWFDGGTKQRLKKNPKDYLEKKKTTRKTCQVSQQKASSLQELEKHKIRF